MGVVYFIKPIGLTGPIKIGFSANPVMRLKPLTSWSPIPLEIAVIAPGTFSHEKLLHEWFAPHRLHGEWFSVTPELTALITDLKAGGELPEKGLHEWRLETIERLRDTGATWREIGERVGFSECHARQMHYRAIRNRKAA